MATTTLHTLFGREARHAATPPGAHPASATAVGPGSVAWKLNREMVLLLGWTPAVLLQLAHPLVAAGVADHSVFLARPDQRLHRLNGTVAAMLALTFGDDEAVARTARRINAIHDGVNGRLAEAAGRFPAGTPYSAHDPALLRWVHATLLYTLPRAYELYVGPLTPAEKDRYCLEASRIGPLLGIPDGELPLNWGDVRAYLRAMQASGALMPSATARGLAREIVAPAAPRVVRPLAPAAYLPTVGLLPPAVRAAYGFRWDRRHALALRLSAALTRRMLPRLPSVLRHWPAYRQAARHLAALHGEPGGATLPAGAADDPAA